MPVAVVSTVGFDVGQLVHDRRDFGPFQVFIAYNTGTSEHGKKTAAHYKI